MMNKNMNVAKEAYETRKLPPTPENATLFQKVGSVLLWYGTNIGVVILNKAMISNFNFQYPIFLTFMHMLSAMFWSEVFVMSGHLKKQTLSTQQQKPVILLGTLFCISVVSGNISFKYIHVSFTQAIGATTPVFTAILTAMFLYKYERTKTYLTLVPVVIGAMLATLHEPMFNMIGFLFGINAAWTRAARSVIQEKLMSSQDATYTKLDSLNLLRFMAPVAALELAIAAFFMEPTAVTSLLGNLRNDEAHVFGFMLFINLILAYFVNLGGMMVTKYNGALTLQVLGNLKGAVATTVSVLVFHNPVSKMAIFGYGICMAGAWAFSESKKAAKAAAVQKENPV